VRKKASLLKGLLILTVLLSLASFVTMAQTAHLGGLIRHTELQGGISAGTGEKGNEKEEETLSVPGNKTDSTGGHEKKKNEEDD